LDGIISELNVRLDTQRDDQKTLEHYTELYVPL
jgi:hypothetical protein